VVNNKLTTPELFDTSTFGQPRYPSETAIAPPVKDNKQKVSPQAAAEADNSREEAKTAKSSTRDGDELEEQHKKTGAMQEGKVGTPKIEVNRDPSAYSELSSVRQVLQQTFVGSKSSQHW